MSSRASEYRRWATDLRVVASLLEEEVRRLESSDAATRVAAERAREAFEERIRALISTRVDIPSATEQMEAEREGTGRKVTRAHKARLIAANAGEERNQTKFAKWLAGQGLSAADWARAHPCPGQRGAKTPKLRWSPSSVRAWMQPKDAEGARAIPEEAAALIGIESKGEVPALETTWPSGISRVRYRRAR